MTFTYTGKETKRITKMFKSTSVRISFKTSNTIERNLHIRAHKSVTMSATLRLTSLTL